MASYVLPVQSAPAPAPVPYPRAGGSGDLCGFDWGQVQYEEFSSDDPLVGLKAGISIMPAVMTRPPRPGYFWIIFALGWRDRGGNLRKRGVFLMPPNVSTPDKVQFFFADTISGVARSIPKAGIRLKGSFNGSTDDQAQNDEHVGVFTPQPLVIPPGWALLLAQDDQSNAPGAASAVLMQVAYAELPIGSISPGFGG
jgi:hypothetical protein